MGKFSQETNSLGVFLFTDALIMIIWPEKNRNLACILFEFSATQQQGAMQRWGGIIGVPWTDFTCTRLHLSLITIILTSVK